MRPFFPLVRLVMLLVDVEKAYSWISHRPSRIQRIHNPSNSQALSAAPLFDVSIWKDDHWKLDSAETTIQLPHVQETWNWCRHFVVKYGLCPWAMQSTETKHAIHFYILQDASVMEDAVERAALEFHQSQKNPQTAISFVIILVKEKENEKSNSNSNSDRTGISFDEFYNRFLDLEDDFLEHDNPILQNDITLAPFHPDWMFAGDDEAVLSFEKRSPYATISIVSAKAIEQAGPVLTEQIGRNNAKILNSRSVDEWQAIYNSAIDPSRDGSSSFE